MSSAAAPGWTGRELGLAVLLVAVYSPALLALARVWASVDYLSHGFLVPVVAGWAAWRERGRLAGLAVRPDPRAAALLALALAAYLVGLAAASASLQGAALVAAAAAAVWLARGAAWLRALAFPLAFLVFMVPPPAAWITPLIVRLQLFVSSAAVALLHALGAPVLRDGNVLALPGGESLFVAEACSGVTSVVTLTPLAVLLAALTLRAPAGRAALVAAVVPLAMAGNLARVVLTVLVALETGVAAATSGLAHQLLGLVTYVVACGLLVAAAAGLRRVELRP